MTLHSVVLMNPKHLLNLMKSLNLKRFKTSSGLKMLLTMMLGTRSSSRKMMKSSRLEMIPQKSRRVTKNLRVVSLTLTHGGHNDLHDVATRHNAAVALNQQGPAVALAATLFFFGSL